MDERALFYKYTEGDLSAEEFERLQRWLGSSPEHVDAFMRFTADQIAIYRHLEHQGLEDLIRDASGFCQVPPRLPDGRESDSLRALAALEDSAVASVVRIAEPEAEDLEPGHASLELSIQEVRTLGKYAAQRLLRSGFVKYAGIAAMLALVVTVLATLLGQPDAPVLRERRPSVAGADSSGIATLTADHRALWAYHSRVDRGATLYPGDRLTLTSGLAQITTRRGATVVMQGPCTVELLDDDNAVRLVSGRLVGRVETDAAQQFKVLTPARDVIDMGTEFGVEVAPSGETGVYVFEGRVVLTEPGVGEDGPGATTLSAGEGRQIDNTGLVTPLADPRPLAAGFVRSMSPAEDYQRIVLRDRPLVYYRFEGEGADAYQNLAGDRYHARPMGAIRCGTERGQSFLDLGAFGDALQSRQNIGELRGADSYSIECWVRTQREGFGVICSIEGDDASGAPKRLAAARLETCSPGGQLGPANHLRFVHVGLSVQQQLDNEAEIRKGLYSDAPHRAGRWTHIAVVKSGEQTVLYIDGRAHDRDIEDGALLDVPLRITLGKFFGKDQDTPAFSRQFIGQIDEFAVYNHALSVDAIQARATVGRLYVTE
jgi:ferric-dicitrate binding protein FerR (iron transport regulator)